MYDNMMIDSEKFEDRVIFKASGSLIRPAGTMPPGDAWVNTTVQTIPNTLGFGFPAIFQWSTSPDFTPSYPMFTIDGSIFFILSSGVGGIFCAYVDNSNIYFRTVSGTASPDTIYYRCIGLHESSQSGLVSPTNTSSAYPYLYNSDKKNMILVVEHTFSRVGTSATSLQIEHDANSPLICLAWFVDGGKHHQLSISQQSELEPRTPIVHSNDTYVICDFPDEATYTNSVYVRGYYYG